MAKTCNGGYRGAFMLGIWLLLSAATTAPLAAQQRLGSGPRHARPVVRLLPEDKAILSYAESRSVIANAAPDSDRDEGVEGSKRSLMDAVRYTETPFVQEYSFPIRELWDGHVEIGGFSSVHSMENILWGPPAAGSLPAWGVTSQSHVAVSVPSQAGSFGFTLALHATASDNGRGYFRPEEWVSRLIRSSRDSARIIADE